MSIPKLPTMLTALMLHEAAGCAPKPYQEFQFDALTTPSNQVDQRIAAIRQTLTEQIDWQTLDFYEWPENTNLPHGYIVRDTNRFYLSDPNSPLEVLGSVDMVAKPTGHKDLEYCELNAYDRTEIFKPKHKTRVNFHLIVEPFTGNIRITEVIQKPKDGNPNGDQQQLIVNWTTGQTENSMLCQASYLSSTSTWPKQRQPYYVETPENLEDQVKGLCRRMLQIAKTGAFTEETEE